MSNTKHPITNSILDLTVSTDILMCMEFHTWSENIFEKNDIVVYNHEIPENIYFPQRTLIYFASEKTNQY